MVAFLPGNSTLKRHDSNAPTEAIFLDSGWQGKVRLVMFRNKIRTVVIKKLSDSQYMNILMNLYFFLSFLKRFKALSSVSGPIKVFKIAPLVSLHRK